MGLSKPKAPDTSAQEAELERQRLESEERRRAEELELERDQTLQRRRNRGRQSLINTSETGVADTTTG